MPIYTNLKKIHDKNGEVEFEAEIPSETLESYIVEALEHAARNFKMPGFRPGKVPHDVVRRELGEMALLEDAANDALRDAMREVMQSEELKTVGLPQITITKLAPKNPVGFKARFALFPDIKLPDYKKIGRTISERKSDVEVTDADVEAGLERIKKMFAMGHGGEGTPMPEINDAFVKQLGPFENVEAFKTELKRQLAKEKELNAMELKRDEIVREIVKESKFKIPQLLIDQEFTSYMEEELEHLKQAGIKFEDYLKESKKTPEQFEKDQRALVEDQIRTGLVLRAVREAEGVTPDEREVQMNIAQLKLRYPDRDEKELRESALAISIQKKLFEVLEGKS